METLFEEQKVMGQVHSHEECESWDEMLEWDAEEKRPRGFAAAVHRHPRKEELLRKKYRVVFEPESESVRLETKQYAASEVTSSVDKLELDSRIAEAIEASRSILALEDNWDEEGSPGYTEATWKRATEFIKDTAIDYWRVHRSWITPPRIMPGPEGSIDVHWKTPNREILINIPDNLETPAGYYGSGGPQDTVKGKLDTSSQNLWVLTWLLR